MCYKCGICSTVVPHGTPRRVHVVYRNVLADRQYNPTTGLTEPRYRTEIAQEIPVCCFCRASLTNGTPLSTLLRRAREEARREETMMVNHLRHQPHSPKALRPKLEHLKAPSLLSTPRKGSRPTSNIPC